MNTEYLVLQICAPGESTVRLFMSCEGRGVSNSRPYLEPCVGSLWHRLHAGRKVDRPPATPNVAARCSLASLVASYPVDAECWGGLPLVFLYVVATLLVNTFVQRVVDTAE